VTQIVGDYLFVRGKTQHFHSPDILSRGRGRPEFCDAVRVYISQGQPAAALCVL